MDTATLINLLLKKFPVTSIEFERVDKSIVVVRISSRRYQISFNQLGQDARYYVTEMGSVTHFSSWLAGILNGLVRNDAGELVSP